MSSQAVQVYEGDGIDRSVIHAPEGWIIQDHYPSTRLPFAGLVRYGTAVQLEWHMERSSCSLFATFNEADAAINGWADGPERQSYLEVIKA